DADAARVVAVGTDDHDVVAVAQVFAVAAAGARVGLLIIGERVGDLLGRSGADVARAVHIPRVLVIVAGDVGRNVLLLQHDSEDQTCDGGDGQRAGDQKQAVAAHGCHRLAVWTTVPPEAAG